jgi:Fe-S oxidoreductase/FAD/FMN-containing dehydrogenase
VDNVEELDILTYDGHRMRVGPTSDHERDRIIRAGGRRSEIYEGLTALRDRYAGLIRERYPELPRRVSGYNLPQLLPEDGFHVARALVGTEGTCVTVLEATVRLVHSPPRRTLLVLGYPDVFTACDHIPEIMAHGPIGLEGMDDCLIKYMERKGLRAHDVTLLPEGGGWLLVEFGGEDQREANDRAKALADTLSKKHRAPCMKLLEHPDEQSRMWKVREAGLAATAHVPHERDAWTGWEDSAVPPRHLGDYLRNLRSLLDRYDYQCSLYGHFGQGCVHVRIPFGLRTHESIRQLRSFLNEASDLVLRYGGSLSGEHGDGQSRADLLPKMYGSELVEAFREFKSIWDPDWKMNPGKVVAPYRIEDNLRIGTDYRPPELDTHFKFPLDDGSFAKTTLRCVGVGECRRTEGGTMCPSYMVTREEKHSTRGRARLLFEMLEGDPLTGGWRDEHVKESLDLCLACKGCKSDCPVRVDMATYKAEFLSHYYDGKLRPRAAYSMGLIHWWARLASVMPNIANIFTQTPGLSSIAKAIGGISQARRLPPFAVQAFTDWFHRRERRQSGKRVLLWPDTFNNYFYPETPKAAVEVLEAAGFCVAVPRKLLCCGRPLYDFGMLDLAKRQLREILQVLKTELEAGTPIVGLEPSCVAVFRDELTGLFPHDEDAKRLSAQAFTLGEFLDNNAKEFELPTLNRAAIVHGHCHHKAVIGMDDESTMLSKLGLDYDILDSGCCGMSGSFGFNSRHYDMSMQIGERVLLPAVREASKETLIIADGFSCREQIAQSTDRRALHLAQVIQMAIHEGPEGPAEPYPEMRYNRNGAQPRHAPREKALLIGVGFILLAALFWWAGSRRKP